MRTPTSETSPGALVSFLNTTTSCYMADLYTITLSGGIVLRYTDRELPVTIGTNTFDVGPGLKRGKTKLSVGISVDTLEVTIDPGPAGANVNGIPIIQFVNGGGFDGASLLLERAFAAAPGADWVGTLGMFTGRVAITGSSRYDAQLTVNSSSELLNVMVPRNVYQPSCNNTLFDAACGLSKSAHAKSVVANSATDLTLTSFSLSTASVSDGLLFTARYAQGFAVGITGANAGVARTLKTNSYNTLQTIRPWAAAVASGDTFVIYPGCDKTQATCSNKFANLVHFRGQPYVPAPETIA